MLRKFGIIAVVSLLAVAFAAVPALAVTNFANAPQGAHYAQGSGEPTCTVDPVTLNVSCTGTNIQGVGNTNATASLVANYSITGTCTNRGGNLVEPFTRTATSSSTQTFASNRNGELRVGPSSVTAPTEAGFLATFRCPNPNWTADVSDITLTSYTYTLTFAGFTQPAITVTGP